MTPQRENPLAQYAPEKIRLVTDHQTWLQHPVTQQLRKQLAARKDKIIGRLQTAALYPDRPDHESRVIAIELATLNVLEKHLYDTEEYVKNIV